MVEIFLLRQAGALHVIAEDFELAMCWLSQRLVFICERTRSAQAI